MAANPQAIAKLSIRHETIMDFLMANPTISLGEVARHFNFTPGWLSQVVHSDVFQDELRRKKDIAFHHTVLPLRDKLQLVAHMALDKLAVQLPNETDTATVNKVAENVLERLGFTAKGPTTQVNLQQNVTVLRSEIERAREVFGKGPKAPVLEVEKDDSGRCVIALPAAGEISGEDLPGLGSAFEGTFLALAEREHGGAAEGVGLREEDSLVDGEEIRG